MIGRERKMLEADKEVDNDSGSVKKKTVYDKGKCL